MSSSQVVRKGKIFNRACKALILSFDLKVSQIVSLELNASVNFKSIQGFQEVLYICIDTIIKKNLWIRAWLSFCISHILTYYIGHLRTQDFTYCTVLQLQLLWSTIAPKNTKMLIWLKWLLFAASLPGILGPLTQGSRPCKVQCHTCILLRIFLSTKTST